MTINFIILFILWRKYLLVIIIIIIKFTKDFLK